VLLTNGAAAREPRRISPILAQVATSGSGARLFREQHFGAYRANSALPSTPLQAGTAFAEPPSMKKFTRDCENARMGRHG